VAGVPGQPLPPFVGLLASLPLATLLLWRKEQRIRLISACLLLLLLGILYSNVKAPLRSFDEGHIAYYNDQGWVKIEGTVSGEPDVRDTYTNLRVEVSKIEVKGQKREATGTVLVRAPRYPERDYGDELEIEGLLETPPELEGFSYREYLARQGIYSMLRRAQIVLINRGQGSVFRRTLLSFKRRAQRVIALILHEPQAAASAAVVRAAIMGCLYVIATHYGRQTDALTSLMAAAVLMTLCDPQTLWDLGFQLSFAATLGLIIYTPPLQRWFEKQLSRMLAPGAAKKVVGMLNEALIVTLAAQITTMPIIVYHFRRLSLITLLSNFFVLPAQPGVMLWGGLATIAGLIWLPLGQVLGWIAWLFLTYTIRVVEITARIPYASLKLGHVSPSTTACWPGLP